VEERRWLLHLFSDEVFNCCRSIDHLIVSSKFIMDNEAREVDDFCVVQDAPCRPNEKLPWVAVAVRAKITSQKVLL